MGQESLAKYESYLRDLAYVSPITIRNYLSDQRQFMAWCEETDSEGQEIQKSFTLSYNYYTYDYLLSFLLTEFVEAKGSFSESVLGNTEVLFCLGDREKMLFGNTSISVYALFFYGERSPINSRNDRNTGAAKSPRYGSLAFLSGTRNAGCGSLPSSPDLGYM